jgi:hypothetical protein
MVEVQRVMELGLMRCGGVVVWCSVVVWWCGGVV